jgi:hypothetical protein
LAEFPLYRSAVTAQQPRMVARGYAKDPEKQQARARIG